MQKITSTRIRSLSLSLLSAVVTVLIVRGVVLASPVTSGSLASGAEVYQGLIAVTSGESGSSLMEIGLGGTTIASSSDLYLRPNGLTEALGVKLENIGGKTTLDAIGGLCLGGSCLDVWPSGGSGTSYWQLNAGRVQPLTSSNSLTFDKGGANAINTGLELAGKTASAALSVTNPNNGTAASAASFSGDLNLYGQTNVDTRPNGDEIVGLKYYCDSNRQNAGDPYSYNQGQACNPGQWTNGYPTGDAYCQSYGTGGGGTDPNAVCRAKSYKVWHAGNDGHTTQKYCLGGQRDGQSCSSDTDCGYFMDQNIGYGVCTAVGLDAGLIDDYPLEFRYFPSSSGSCNGQASGTDQRCLCTNYFGSTECIRLQ